MNLPSTALSLVLALSSITGSRAAAPAELVPLTRAHSHNDYEHERPLLDALDQGFCSIEADIYLVDGHLLVAHDLNKTRPGRTLQSLYLDPLLQRTRANGGRVYRGGPPVVLLVDVKSDAEATYRVLRDMLRQYSPMLTRFSSAGVQTNAVTVIISGNRARPLLERETERYAALDGRPEDLEGSAPKELIPLVSEDWKRLFQWRGSGSFPAAERARLANFVEKAHAQGRKVRFWGTPDQPEMWRTLLEAGVDVINADNLRGLREFLQSAGSSQK